MINKKIGRLRLELYSSIDELPAERYHKFNLYSLLSAGIGNDVESIQGHISRIYEALQKKDFERLQTMFQNYYHSLHFILEQIDTQSISFACLVHSINGQEIKDLSDENLKKVSSRITKSVKRAEVLNLVQSIKKKLKRKSKPISPIESAIQEQKHIMDSLKGVLT